MSVTIDYDDRRGYIYACPCGFGGTMPSIYSDAVLIEAHLRDCQKKPTDQPRTPRASRGASNGNSKLTAETVREIRRRHERGETQIALAQHFGIAQVTVSGIIRRQRWTDVD